MGSQRYRRVAIVHDSVDGASVCCSWSYREAVDPYGLEMAVWAHDRGSGEYWVEAIDADGSLTGVGFASAKEAIDYLRPGADRDD